MDFSQLTLPHYLPSTALGPECVFMGWWMRRDSVMTVAKTTDLDPSGTPDLGPLGTLWS